MKRTTVLLAVLALILVLVIWYLLLWSPRADELEAVEAQIVEVEAQQAAARSRIVALQAVREQAPQLQAEHAAAESLLPRDTALPSALRQLQQAADDAGLTLVSVAPSRPEPVEGSEGLYVLGLTAEFDGTYFQVIDVLRRIEEPDITPRGIVWDSAALSIGEEAPDLVTVVTGRMFAVLPTPPALTDGEAVVPSEEDPEGEADVDVDVEVETDEEGDQ
ncbi:MAG: type 4a pilus biogenesis protein PilO [Nitriliruptor sp.]